MSTIKEKLPIEFKNEMKELLGDEYDSFIQSYDCERTSAIRVNSLKVDRKFFKDINLFNIDYDNDRVKWADLGYYVSSGTIPGRNPLHDAGAYYIQEPSAMSVVGKTEISEGEKILDMCAAPGGKSTYILSKLKDTGILVSNEISNTRIRALGENLERFGATNCIITNSNSKELLTFFKGFFDKVFIDAPCSGQGMFRKYEHAIDDWSEEKVKECVNIQKEIIRDGYKMLKNGGMLIYSTCTFTKRENEEIVEDFLDEHEEAELVEMDRIWPHKDRGEGHFCARILKHIELEDETNITNRKKAKKKKGKETSKIKKDASSLKYYNEFISENIKDGTRISKLIKENNLELRGDFLYLVPKDLIDVEGLKVLRKGLLMGEIKKNRFEPAHSLAMAIGMNDVKNAIRLELDDEDIYNYIYGESISSKGKKYYRYGELNESDNESKGWVLVTINGVSIGWAKESNGLLKNKYPKGLRRIIRK